MNENEFKIGYSEIGGIYIGKNIQSGFHKHYAVSILLSFGEPFKITTEDNKQESFKAAIIQKRVGYSLQTSPNDYVVFIHIVPYSENGMMLSDKNTPIRNLEIEPFSEVLGEFKSWFESPVNDPEKVESLLNRTSSIPEKRHCEKMVIDERIKNALDLITQSNDEKLSIAGISKAVHLSASHFAHLFKKETGMTFRGFILHVKLIRSIYAMYEDKNLTDATFIGGFSDQPHFTRTFKDAFGIKPSSSIK